MLEGSPLTGSLSQGTLYDNYVGTGGASAIKDFNLLDEYGNNIINATKIAMERAVSQILDNYNTEEKLLIIDGIGWENKDFIINNDKYNVVQVVKGDAKFRNIAAASILAKEAHDQHILELCSNNTDLDLKYDLSNNKGYGTKKHIEGIKKHGLSDYHRQSFNINY